MNNKKNIFITDLNQPNHIIQWCPGCGDFGILFAIKRAIIQLNLDPKNVVIVSGIGCSSKLPHYIKTYGVESLHGRALPVATGIKYSNKKLHVIVVGGDGDGYGIGLGHFIHTIRRDIDVTYIVHNNETYGLTKGQASPTTKKGIKTSSTPFGVIDNPINPISLALTSGCNFVARGYSNNMIDLSNLIIKGIKHRGFSFIDVIQLCPSYNKIQTDLYYKDKFININCLKNYDNSNRLLAINKAMEKNSEKINIGIFYEDNSYLPFEENFNLIDENIKNININNLIDDFK